MSSNVPKECPFCGKSYKGLGNHLPFCLMGENRDYTCYLSQKTINKRACPRATATTKKCCHKCGKWFKHLDTHLRLSARCKQVPSSLVSSSPLPSHSTVSPNINPQGRSGSVTQPSSPINQQRDATTTTAQAITYL